MGYAIRVKGPGFELGLKMPKIIRNSISHLISALMLIPLALPCYATLQPDAPISADQAFAFQVKVVNSDTLEFSWEIAPGHHLYQDQLHILNKKNQELLNPDNLPAGNEVVDPVLGNSVEYEKQLTIKLPIDNQISDELLVHYQGCSDVGFCYEPESRLIRLDGKNPSISKTELQEFPAESEANQIASEIKDRFLPLTLLIFFGLGFILSFSPCVLPMIPLIVNLIIGEKKISTRKSAFLASIYVLGMACTYAVAGTLVGMLGAQLQAWLQQPVVLIPFSVVLILLALSQLELIRIKVPSFNRKLHHWGQRQLQGSATGAFILGIIASLIVSPCVTPPLIGALTYIGHNGNPLIGGLTLFSLGLGMGVPLILVALLSSVILPKAGRWMNLVKIGTAIALLGLAIWILQRIVSPSFSLVLWAGLCAVFAWYLRKGDKLLKSCALILAISAFVFVILAATEHHSACRAEGAKEASKELQWYTITSEADLQKHLETAKVKNVHTMVDVTATWCINCKRIEQGVFTDPQVQQQLQHMMLLRLDVSNVSDKENQLLNMLKVYGPPALLFFDSNGKEIGSKRLTGSVSVAQLLNVLKF
jgi:thiol:disulfide interchange protein DsbD